MFSKMWAKILDSAFEYALAALITVLFGLYSLLGTTVLDWINLLSKPQVALVSFVIPTIFFVTLFLSIKFWFSHALHFPHVRRDFSIQKCEMSYLVKDTTIEFIKKKELIPKRSKITFYIDIYRWTGTGKAKLTSLVSGHKIEEIDRATIWQPYRINFGRQVEKGKLIQTSIKWTIPDTGDSVPFVSTTIEEPTKELTFRFKPKKDTVASVFFEERFSISAKEPFNPPLEIKPNEEGEYVHTLSPKLYYYYEMRWIPLLAD